MFHFLRKLLFFRRIKQGEALMIGLERALADNARSAPALTR